MVQATNPNAPDVAVIQDCERRLEKRFLRKEGTVWYADFIASPYPEELLVAGNYIEGLQRLSLLMRMSVTRLPCIAYHGALCKCCGFDFEKKYGEHGKGFIHVHHLRPLRTLGEDYRIDPVNELVPLCPNCHAMIHRGNEAKPLSVEELRAMMKLTG
ncbi:HNH endonuclease (plasmid) [Klebsiella variicola]|nr:HNH endonuclease [Klebsiella variicola]